MMEKKLIINVWTGYRMKRDEASRFAPRQNLTFIMNTAVGWSNGNYLPIMTTFLEILK
jgi:hypothetical protein